jgi:hypothetical protein
MTLIVEDGTGLPNAESYVSVAEADTYFTSLGNPAWAADTAAKEVALRKATQYLDDTYQWKGKLVSDTQALGWPRTGVYDSEGRDISDSVPVKLKKAAFELALTSITTPLVEDLTNAAFVKREKVGELEVEYQAGAPTARQFTLVERLLSGLYTSTGSGGSLNVGVIRA